ncbi:MAG TPA: hypothetical protein PLI45_03785 [Candidatus Woesebacteria bacterium]|nr:hypothetical protein [Candidatus Woesebacteria bacterium]
MDRYSVKCPVPGCPKVYVLEAIDWEEAFKKAYEKGNQHILMKHPDFPDSPIREEMAREYAKEYLKKI